MFLVALFFLLSWIISRMMHSTPRRALINYASSICQFAMQELQNSCSLSNHWQELPKVWIHKLQVAPTYIIRD